MRLLLLAVIIVGVLLLSGVLTVTGFQVPQITMNLNGGVKKVEQGWKQILGMNATNTTSNITE